MAKLAFSCVGARPSGMRGGFIAIADNQDAVYWNPAGLIQLKKPILAMTFTLTGKDQMGYRQYLFFAKPKIGFSYISRLRLTDDLEEWYTLSLATAIKRMGTCY